ncbi:uncharacterized protein C8A04DRAFT_32734 [Dichotomopilus funicola]|uniref:BTB domain-containing protein n=1 Tax=Dichotomopilus funicola TaxID=1934379 RepID=A0AAN6UWF1_9PEZI|nr:hypothetical protein C8A04DRAFT_32734 [Dichotomopilus funicola]
MEEARSWKEISTSPLYLFLIGPEKKEFNIHTAIITKLSPVLEVFVNDTRFKEANEGQADLKDVDEETFTSFVEYAYTGNYKPSFPSSQSPETPQEVAREDDDWGLGSPRNNKLYRRRNQPQQQVSPIGQWGRACNCGYNHWATFDAIVESHHPPSYTPALSTGTAALTADVPMILLHHAHLYVFADCYQIPRLAKMALFSLGRQLQETKQQPTQEVSAEGIVRLLKFCYEEPRTEELRSLVAKYAACSAERLWNDASFKALLKAHAELGADLVEEMVKRMNKF